MDKLIKYIISSFITFIGIIGLLFGFMGFFPTYLIYVQAAYYMFVKPWAKVSYFRALIPFLLCSLLIICSFIITAAGIKLFRKQWSDYDEGK